MMGGQIFLTGLLFFMVSICSVHLCEKEWNRSISQIAVCATFFLSCLAMVIGALIAIWS